MAFAKGRLLILLAMIQINAGWTADFNDSNWIGLSGIAGADSIVYATVLDESENLYIGGNFTVAGDVSAKHIAKWNGTNWAALGSGMSGDVYALAIFGGELYAGGAFTNAGGFPAKYIAKWNGNTWSAVDSGFNAPVRTLTTWNNNLYAGGSFTMASENTANRVAMWNGTAWSGLGLGVGSLSSDVVYSLTVWSNQLIAGGVFTNLGSSRATSLAKWDGNEWFAMGSSSAKVYALALPRFGGQGVNA